MSRRRLLLPTLLLTASLFQAGCSGSKDSGGTGVVSVQLVDGPIGGFQEVNVHILSVEIASGGGWITLGHPDRTYNLLALTGGLSETLASGATLPEGHYSQMRLVLGSGNTVKLADGSVQDLFVPSGLQSGLKLITSFDVVAGTTKDVWIDFDAAHSIQITHTGASDKYLLRPTLRAYDKVATGAVRGTLTEAGTGAPLAGATVYAEVLDGTGEPALARSTFTDAQGAYVLDLLPVGATYHIVSQPKVGTGTVKGYDAQVSPGLALSSGTALQTWSAAFTANAALGTVTGTLTPVATDAQSDLVQLRQSLTPAGGTAGTFIVDSAMAQVGTATETYSLGNLPAGGYTLRGLRRTLNPDGSVTFTKTPASPATVAGGATATVNLVF